MLNLHPDELDPTPQERRSVVRWLAYLLIVAIAGGIATAAWSQPASRVDLSQPMLLVAAENMQGPYAGAVLFAVPAPNGQHIGFIVNRPTGKTMAEVFPEHEPSKAVKDQVYFGGPEAAYSIMAVLRTDPGQPSLRLMEGLYATLNGALIDRIIEETPNAARYYAGFVGWQAGELAEEVRRGWFIVRRPADMLEQLFLPDTKGMAERLRPKGPEA